MVAHLAHTSRLDETCDVCPMHKKRLRYVRNVMPPCRNTLSNANRTRPAAMADELFWTVKAALKTKSVTANGKTFNHITGKTKTESRKLGRFVSLSHPCGMTVHIFNFFQQIRRC